ncbi:MAG: helix-turn-helix domain-containing protein [Propionibacteriaceae bacterium]|jgi:DNA-binding XRE family transcriptional regulator|nr:helix-turn-helix domain-containing protein [Propionibacteriaceae bacterium]
MFTTSREAGQIVRSLREAAGLTGAELAERAGVSPRWLVNLGSWKPHLDMARVMDCLQALGYGLDVTALPDSWAE